MSKKEIIDLQPIAQESDTSVFELRGYLVMLAADVAEIFNVETREIVQNIKRNNEEIRPFEITRSDFKAWAWWE